MHLIEQRLRLLQIERVKAFGAEVDILEAGRAQR
jgi:hypothetical protein